MNKNYIRITYQQMLEDFTTRMKNDPRFRNMSSASIYNLFIEMLTATMDMTNYYMERTAEEAFIDTAKLDSSVIKHGKNLGYNPIRNTPAEAEIAVVIRGPLPNSITNTHETVTIYFPQEEMELTYNGKKYILNTDYSYILTNEDKENGKNSTWSKTIYLSKSSYSTDYIELYGGKYYNDNTLAPIKIFQGEKKLETIYGINNTSKLGKSYQFYDIDNIKFSNWYGKRDPNGWYKNSFKKKNSWCKIGIGKNKEEAFYIENLFDIEDVSIYLNESVIKDRKMSNLDSHKVCSLTTNSDKTIRLRFGDGNIVSNGLNKEDENIYIQYIECDGADANKLGTTGAELKINNSIWATFSGGTPIDISSNIKILFNSDITNGIDFENQQSIKNNAPSYFASNNKLVTKKDFISYFNGLTTPINVNNSIVWSQDEIERNTNVTYKYIQNCICYCIAASLYNTKSNVNGVMNVLTDNSINQSGVFSVYGTSNSYLEHLTDFLKFLWSYNSFNDTQYMNNPSSQWLKNIKTIRDNIEARMIMNSKIYSFPPIVQYYDVVGTVIVDSLSKLQDYKREVENEIYKWLDSNCSFGTKIYKSDIVKFFNKRSETSYVDLNIRVSDIIQNANIISTYSLDENYEVTNIFKYDANNVGIQETGKFNCVWLPKINDSGIVLDKNSLANKQIRIIIKDYEENPILIHTSNIINENENSLILNCNQNYPIPENITFNKDSYIQLVFSMSNTDFSSTSNYNVNNSSLYGLNNENMNELNDFITEWITNSSTVREAKRPIPLPYFISTFDVETRLETIKRKGILQNNYKSQLTEKSFWMYLIPTILENYYSNIDFKNENINDTAWNNVDNLVKDLYPLLKATFADNILDDNNNIVNYSMDNELPAIRLKITYKYGK